MKRTLLPLILCALLLTSACKPGLKFSAPQVSGPETSVDVFKRTVYPILQKNCATCHGQSQSPFFANADVLRAHDELVSTGKANLGNPTQSRIVNRLGTDLHNCWGDCADNSATMLAAVQKWATERPFVEVPLIKTESKRIPDNLSTTPVDLTYSLGGFPGGTFIISVVKFDNFSYRFFNPRVKTSSPTSVYMKGIHILLNSNDPPGSTTYRAVDRVLSSTTTPTVISSASLILEKEKGAGEDYIAIGFEALGNGSGADMGVARFNTARQTILANCGGCHTTGQAPLFAALSTQAEYLAFRWNGNPIVVAGNSGGSRLYQVLNGSTPAMPPSASGATRASLAIGLKSWIDQIQQQPRSSSNPSTR